MLVLDGKASDEVQKEIDEVKSKIAHLKSIDSDDPEVSNFIAKVLLECEENGQLVHYHISLRSCDICNKRAGYAKHKRRGRYHNKGDDNHKRPLSFGGIELAKRFVTMQGHARLGCCSGCMSKIKEPLSIRLRDVKAEIPESLTGFPPKWKKWDRMKCKECGWEGHEGQMGQLPAMMGGYYPGQCPKCEAKSLPLGRTMFNHIDGFDLVGTPEKASKKC